MKTFIPSKKNIDKTFITEDELIPQVNNIINNTLNENINNIITNTINNTINNTVTNIINETVTMAELANEYNKKLEESNKIFDLVVNEENSKLSSITIRSNVIINDDYLKMNYDSIDVSFLGFLTDILSFDMLIEKNTNSFIIFGNENFGLLYQYGYFYILFKRRKIRISSRVNLTKNNIKFIYNNKKLSKSKIYFDDKDVTLNNRDIDNFSIEKNLKINGWFINDKFIGDFNLYNFSIYNYNII